MRATNHFPTFRVRRRPSRNTRVMEGTVRRQPQAWISRLSARRTAGESSPGDEAGSSLVLALVFLVAVSLIVTGLLGWLGTSLTASVVFSSERNIDNAATNAVNLAIQNTRYSFDPSGLLDMPPQSCLSTRLSRGRCDHFHRRLLQHGVAAECFGRVHGQPGRVHPSHHLFRLPQHRLGHKLCGYASPSGRRGIRRRPCRNRGSLNQPYEVLADFGKWQLWREHDAAQLAVEPGGSGCQLD